MLGTVFVKTHGTGAPLLHHQLTHLSLLDDVSSGFSDHPGEVPGHRLRTGAGVVQRLLMQGAVHGADASVFDAKAGELFLDHVHGTETRHLSGDEGSAQLARMDAPVAVGEVFEEELIQRMTVEHDERFLGVLRHPGAEAALDLCSEKPKHIIHECEKRDASEHIAALEWIAIESPSPADFGIELHWDALISHDAADVLPDLLVKLVQHVAAHVIPVSITLMAGR